MRPISDLKNVFLSNGTVEDYDRLANSLERFLDETDEYCRNNPDRVDGSKMFNRIRNRRYGLRKVRARIHV